MALHPRKSQPQGFCLKQGAYDVVCCVCVGLVESLARSPGLFGTVWACGRRWVERWPSLPRFVGHLFRDGISTLVCIFVCGPVVPISAVCGTCADLIDRVGLLFSGLIFETWNLYGPFFYHLTGSLSCGPVPSSLHFRIRWIGLLQSSMGR